jgi:hypothetical protein
MEVAFRQRYRPWGIADLSLVPHEFHSRLSIGLINMDQQTTDLTKVLYNDLFSWGDMILPAYRPVQLTLWIRDG